MTSKINKTGKKGKKNNKVIKSKLIGKNNKVIKSKLIGVTDKKPKPRVKVATSKIIGMGPRPRIGTIENTVVKSTHSIIKDKKILNDLKTEIAKTSYGLHGIRPKKLTRAYFVNEDTGDTLICQFNPNEWYTEHGATYNEIESPGSKYPKICYTGRKLERIPLTVYFYGVKNVTNGKSSSDVEKYFEQLTKPSKVQKNFIKGSNHFISPPICTFVFGSKCYETVVESAKITRKMFNSSLQTMQLEVALQLIVVKR